MSLIILPSAPMPYSQAPVLSHAPSPSKRPKLSLNTATLPSAFGKKATSLRLETLSATSPTHRNTFSNAHEELHLKTPGAKSLRPALSPLATANIVAATEKGRLATSTASEAPSSSASSVSTVESLSSEIPYKLAYNINSILTNGPIPRRTSQRRTFAQSRPMFPAAKKVAFRAPLTEDIKNEKYTMKHSDIESSSSTISTLELSPPEDAQSNDQAESAAEKAESRAKETSSTLSPQRGEKRESSDEEDSDTCPATPVAGRRKRHRQWVWTLGPVKAAEHPAEEDQARSEEAADGGEQQTDTA